MSDMIFTEFLKRNRVCRHDKVSPDVEYAYCPDCGELVENKWYIVRCGCCGIKLEGTTKNGKIIPQEKFCRNCGSKNFTVEQTDKINFVDIRYAIPVKTVVKTADINYTQSWVNTAERRFSPKLLAENFRV